MAFSYYNSFVSIYVVCYQRIAAAGSIVHGATGITVEHATAIDPTPSVIYDGSGGGIVTWLNLVNQRDIYTQRVNAAGSVLWGGGTVVCNASGTQQYHATVSNGAGGAIFSWSDERAGGPVDPDIYAQLVDYSGTVQWASNGVVVCNAMNPQTGLVSAPDEAGGAFFVWRDGRSTIDYDVYAQNFDSDATIPEQPICDMQPGSLDFGEIALGYHSDLDFFLTNIGGEYVTGSISESCADLEIISGSGSFSLAGNDTVWVTVRYTPTANDSLYCAVGTGSICGSLLCTGYATSRPVITSVSDVPADQGGLVHLTWDAPWLDSPPNREITHYSVWRSINGPEAAMLMKSSSNETDLSEIGLDFKGPAWRQETVEGVLYAWEYITSVDAYYWEEYSYTCETLFDSCGSSDGMHYFSVIAHTSDQFVHWKSHPDSGYSVDNISPAVPLGLAGDPVQSPAGLQITWEPNDESDLAGYRIYRGADESFVPGPGNLLASTPDTTTRDEDWSWMGGFWYKVSAIDIHDNESPFAVLSPDMVTGEDPAPIPDATFLSQNYPNPFNPSTTIEFGLKAKGHVSLRIYDAAGRLVAVLVEEKRSAGRYTAEWSGRSADGSTAASGVYFYRLTADDFEETKKMIMLR
jgi:hypothetical protein